MKNKKGFTLIELIAVIVILSVIILIATTAIGPLIMRARKGALGEEGLHMVEAAKFAYETEEIEDSGKVKGSSSKCYSLSYLNNNKYFDKGKAEGYTGSVLIEYDEETESYTYKFWVSNGTYVFSNITEEEYNAELGKDGKTASENCGGQKDYEKDPTLPDPEPEDPEPEDPEPDEEYELDICTSPGVIVHDGTIDVNGDGEYDDAGDGGCRYSGNNPNNFICFGKGSESYNNGTSTTCPDRNLYRIIGKVPVKIDGKDAILRKIIKSEYVTYNEIGENMKEVEDKEYYYSTWTYLKRVKELPYVYWPWTESTIDNPNLIWEISSLYWKTSYFNVWLDGRTLASVDWNVGGIPADGVLANTYLETAKEVYDKENSSEYGASVTANKKMGVMYIYDYAFASSKEDWANWLDRYSTLRNENNWLFNGVPEWTISRNSGWDGTAFVITSSGRVSYGDVRLTHPFRPVFYFTSDTKIMVSEDTDGSDKHPYRVIVK